MACVTAGLVRFSYVREGAGPPVLLLPGGGGWRLTFRSMVDVLAGDHTVIALDPPGQGDTTVIDPTFPYGVDGIARATAAFLDAVGIERTAVVGHSWGGGFALRFSQLYPDRVSRLALLAPAGVVVRDAWEFRLIRLPLVGEIALRFTSKGAARHMLRKSFAHQERIPDDLVDDVVGAMRSQPDRAARIKQMLAVERSVDWTDTERDLHQVNLPVLLLWAGQDRSFPPEALPRLTSRLPNVQTHVLAHCGHSLHDDCPDKTYAHLLPFLSDPDP